MSLHRRLSFFLLRAVSRAAAWALSRTHDLVHVPLSFTECEDAGLPHGTLEDAPAINFDLQVRRRWQFGIWLDDDTDNPEGCLHIDLFRAEVEVFYYRKGQNEATSRAYAWARFLTRIAIEDAARGRQDISVEGCAASAV